MEVASGQGAVDKVKAARKEEVDYMVGRKIWEVRPIEECWRETGKKPGSVRWVDTDKGFMAGEMMVRSRLVAMDFKGGDKDRDDLFAGSPPLEAKRLLLSRAGTRRGDGRKGSLCL